MKSVNQYPRIGDVSSETVAEFVAESRFHDLDSFMRPYVRQVEDNVRMIAGRHWDVWLPQRGRFVNVLKYLDRKQRRWKQRPVVNWVGYWYAITLAKMTENPPVLSFVPATADRADALLAEVMDPIYKFLWDDIGMDEKVDQLFRWVVSAGAGYLKSYWDPEAGPMEEFRGPAEVQLLDQFGRPMVDPATGAPVIETVPDAPMAPDPETGEIMALLKALPGGDFIETGEPFQQPPGNIGVDVLGPLEVRCSPEPVPFREKAWKIQRSVMHVDEIEAEYGVRVEPDVDEDRFETLNQLLFGLGNMGASAGEIPTTVSEPTEGFAWVYEMWEKPREEAPEGRKTITTRKVALEDGPNPIEPDFNPFRRFDFLMLADRPFGKSPVEDIAPVQRMYNRVWAQILEHTNLMANPMWVVDAQSGITHVENVPGSTLKVNTRQGVQRPIYALEPPKLSDDVWNTLEKLRREMEDLGSLRSGSEGRPPTRDPSGELIKELRFNDDRYVGPPLRRSAHTIASLVESWQSLLRFGWSEERMIRVSGSENAARFMTVGPAMFEGRVNVKAVAESMLPEGRGERQRRLDFWVQQELIDRDTYFDLYQHPHLGRAARPGGVHRSMAEMEHARMLRGEQQVPAEAHDDDVHLAIHMEFMASPEYDELEPEVQQLFQQHVQLHRRQRAEKAVRDAAEATAVQADVAALQGAAAETLPAGPAEAGPASQNGASGQQGNAPAATAPTTG